MRSIARFIREEKAATVVEYSVMLALISVGSPGCRRGRRSHVRRPVEWRSH